MGGLWLQQMSVCLVLCASCPHPSKGGAGEVAGESQHSRCWRKGKLMVAVTSLTWEDPLSENSVEKVHLCKH